ncbi:thiamine phosphate synthase [Paracoccaceae bacterium]|nr:thiamine phosphate synthase [Paracoccaceae bacterium]
MFDAVKLKLYLVTDPHLCATFGLLNTVNAAVKGGITMVQLRDKEASTNDRICVGKELQKILKDTEIPLIINDDVEAALAIDADGIHIGQNDKSTVEIRGKVGKDKIVGLSCETIEDAKAADPALVDYIGISPVFPTPTKSDFNAYIGLDGISDIANATSLPSVAIGGLKREHCGKIFSSGCQGMAVVSAICGKDNPYMETKLLHDEIRRVFEDNKSVN